MRRSASTAPWMRSNGGLTVSPTNASCRSGRMPLIDGGLGRSGMAVSCATTPPPVGALDQRGDVGDLGGGDHDDGHVGADRAGGEAHLAHRPEPLDEVVLGLMDEHVGVHDASPPTLG